MMKRKHMKALREQRAKANVRLRAHGYPPCDHEMTKITDAHTREWLKRCLPGAMIFYGCPAKCEVWFVL